MDVYRPFIRQLASDILNGKKDFNDITSRRDFFHIQYSYLKMGKIDMVKKMGEVARAWNLRRGTDIEKERNDPAK